MKREEFLEKFEEASEVLDIDDVRDSLTKSVELSSESDSEYPRGHRNLIIAIEELSELQKELTKELRGKGDITAILEEVADVQIVLEQVKVVCRLKDVDVNRAINLKIDRLNNVIKKEGYYK